MKISVLENIKPRYIVNEQGKKTEVVLSVKTYQLLLEELEDSYLGRVAEAALKHDTEQYSLDEIKREILGSKPKKRTRK